MLVGLALVGGGMRNWATLGLLGIPPLFVVPWLLGMGTVLFWALTVILESPFCRWMLSRGQRTWDRAIRVSLFAQSISYALLVVAYLSVSYMGVYTQTQLRHALSFVKEPIGWVYFINPDDGDVWRIRTNGENKERVRDAHLENPMARLIVRKDSDEVAWDLLAVPGDRGSSPTLLIPRFANHCVRTERVGRGGPYDLENTWFSFGPPADFRPEDQRDVHVSFGFWAAEGVRPTHGNESTVLSLETPFAQRISRNGTILPSSQMVYQLGDHMVILDLKSRDLGFLTMGRRPVVALDSEP